MSGLRAFVARVFGLFTRRRVDRRMAEEMDEHLALLADDYVAQGMTPANAMRAARRAFGGVDQVREQYREQQSWAFAETLLQDARHAARLFLRARGFTALVIMTLALGISVNNTFFTLVNALCLRGLPVEDPERVLSVTVQPLSGEPAGLSYAEWRDVRAEATSFEQLGAYSTANVVVFDDGKATERLAGAQVSAEVFRILGEAPLVGRAFTDDDDRRGAQPVVVLNERVWRTRYDADVSLIGRSIIVDGAATVVVGVMRDEFRFPSNAVIWRPVVQSPDAAAQPRDRRSLSVLGRVRPDTTASTTQAELDVIAARLAGRYPATNQDVRLVSRPINEHFNGRLTDPVWLAFLSAGFLVLLVAWANVANLLSMRAVLRAKEFAIRTAMGATRLRLLRQLLVESALLALAGGLGGLLLSLGAVEFIVRSVPASAPLGYWIRFTFDTRTFSMLAVVCLASVFVFGLMPALVASGTKPNDALKQGGSAGRFGRTLRYATAGLLAIELGLAFVLVNNVGLIIRQFHSDPPREASVPREMLLTASFTLPTAQYATAQQRESFQAMLLDRVRAIPGVSGVAISAQLPLSTGSPKQAIVGDLVDLMPRKVKVVPIGPDYFRTLDVPLKQGREFQAEDGGDGHEVAIVDSRFVEVFGLSGSGIGRVLALPTSGSDTATPRLTIVGLSPRLGAASDDPVVYVPYRTSPAPTTVLTLRATGSDPIALVPALREQVRRLDPSLPLFRVLSLAESTAAATWNGRISATIADSISAIALVLALVGLYTVTTHAVVQRTAEIGIRMALGATRSRVAVFVLRIALARVAGGLVLGVLATYAWELEFGDSTSSIHLMDVVALLPTVAAVLVSSLVACVVPTLRAARLDPIATLRHE